MNVLTAIDLSAEGHDWLMARAGGFAARLGAKVDAIFIHPSARPIGELDDTRAAIAAQMAMVPEQHRGEAKVEVGDVVEVLVRMSHTYDALVVGPRDPSGFAALLGPIGGRVLRRAVCPVLVPRRGSWPADRKLKILVGIDVNGDIRHATTVMAGLWARRLDATIDAVYATGDRPKGGRDVVARQQHERAWREAHEPTRRALEGLLVHVPEAARGVARVEPGEADEVVVQLSNSYDLVLVGNRDREDLSRFVLGPVATTVVRQALCDVLTLPTASIAKT